MAFLDPYQLEEIVATLQNWHTVYNDNLQLISDSIGATILKEVLGENITSLGTAVHLHTDSKLYKAKADDSTKLPVTGLMIDTGTAPAEKRCQRTGLVTGLAGLSAGDIYYLSTTAGGIGTTPPVDGNVIKIGKAITTTSLLLDIQDHHRGVVVFHFTLSNVPAGQTDQPLPLINDPLFLDAVLPFDGCVIGIGAAGSVDPGAGTFTAEPAINGVGTGLTVALSNGTQRNSSTQVPEADPVSATDYMGVIFTTDGPWDNTVDVVVTVYVLLH